MSAVAARPHQPPTRLRDVGRQQQKGARQNARLNLGTSSTERQGQAQAVATKNNRRTKKSESMRQSQTGCSPSVTLSPRDSYHQTRQRILRRNIPCSNALRLRRMREHVPLGAERSRHNPGEWPKRIPWRLTCCAINRDVPRRRHAVPLQHAERSSGRPAASGHLTL